MSSLPRTREVGARTYHDFLDEQLEKAVAAVKLGMSFRQASEKYGVSKSTIQRHLVGKNCGKFGRPYVFLQDDENILTECIKISADWGFPLTMFEVRLIVKGFLDKRGVKEKRFQNNMPGKSWAYGFLKRHKDSLSQRLCQNINRSRASVTPEVIENYFSELEISLKDVIPEVILNYDETNITDDPGRNKIIARRGSRHPEKIIDHSRASISVMFTGSASGHLLPPYVVYRAQNLYTSWTENGPVGTRYNKSKNSWFNMSIFEDYFTSLVLPYFKKFDQNLPKVMIGDNLASHISVPVIEECKRHNIRFVLLPPNSTHLCQPLDVAFFRPLKIKWSETLRDWKSTNRGTIPKDHFPRLLKKCIDGLNENKATEKNLKAGFRGTGIYPLNKDEVLKRMPTKGKPESTTGTSSASDSPNLWREVFTDFLEESRAKQTQPTRKRKRKVDITPGKSVESSDISPLLQQESGEASSLMQTTSQAIKNSVSSSAAMRKRVRVCDTGTNNLSSSEESDEAISLHDSSSGLEEFSSDTDDVSSSLTITKQDNTVTDIPVLEEVASGNACNVSVGSFAVVKFECATNSAKKSSTVKFIGQVISHTESLDQITFKFMRKSMKCQNVFVFPVVDDIAEVNLSQVIEILKPLAVRRGRYTFAYELN